MAVVCRHPTMVKPRLSRKGWEQQSENGVGVGNVGVGCLWGTLGRGMWRQQTSVVEVGWAALTRLPGRGRVV